MRFKVITPEKVVLDTETQGVFVKAIDGELGILPGHIPLMTALDIGVAHYLNGEGESDYISVTGGTFKVENDIVTILTELAELGEDINEASAKMAADRARAELEGLIEHQVDKHSPDVERARLALLTALTRMKTAEKSKKRL